MDALAAAADDDFCYLTTCGRVTGAPHKIEIWFALEGSRLYMLAGAGRRSDWVRNLDAQPAVTIRIRDVTQRATARVVTDAGEDRLARTLLFEKYEPRNPGLASWRESALPVAFDIAYDGS
ncbi:MAG: nitroreductase/quinone reductase family protein [Acidimicrobiia bacterium]